MAYFLPSYFQKRLLRYALTRLELIDTDAINLDDLDISLGQRSVIELKNVGIRVDKLIEKLKIPSTVILKHAVIKQLRLTIPADLHASGIDVLVDGVDVDVEVSEQELARKHSSSAPSHEDVGNRPRSASQSLHDPGGDRTDNAAEHVLPTSEDLAHSFLEAEPRQERAQLEAALQSRSQYMSESIASLEEAGLGDPGGFSLPTFVADFFTGVANRLSVTIKNVEVVAGLSLALETIPSETVKVMLRLAEISLSGMDNNLQSQQKRRIEITGFEVLLMCEPEAFSQHSTSSSPRLSRSRSKAWSSLGSGSFSQFESPEHGFPTTRSEQSTMSDRTPSDLHLSPLASHSSVPVRSDVPPESSLLISSRLSRSSSSQGDGTALDQSFSQPRHLPEDDLMESSTVTDTPRAQLERMDEQNPDLSESKLFTHEEAESMYMSAMSHDLGSSAMPGAWASDQQDLSMNNSSEHASVSSEATNLSTRVAKADQDELPHANDHILSDNEPTATDTKPTLTAKRLLEIDQISIALQHRADVSYYEYNHHADATRSYSSTLSQDTGSVFYSVYGNMRSTLPRTGTTGVVSDSTLFQSTHPGLSPHDFSLENIDHHAIAVGQISCYIDLSIARILVQASAILKKLVPSPPNNNSVDRQPSRPLSLQVQIANVKIQLCQSVPVASDAVSDRDSSTCLLQLSLARISHEMTRREDGLQQKLVINKIEIGQAEDRVLYFVDSMNVQNSIATSTMIRPDDLVVLHIKNRLDVQLKPVHIILDLLLVDDILSRGGGLDSLLDLGASAASVGTVREAHQNETSTPRRRSVRFDNQHPPTRANRADSEDGQKIDVRFSGALVDLVGSETSLQLKTTAIKIVSRSHGSRVQVDKAVIIGPLVHGSPSAADISIKLDTTTIVYLDSPAEEDLERLLSLITPSHDKYDDEDDIMVPTLIRQRRKGGVLRLSTADVQVNVRGITWQKHLTVLVDELSKLSAVSKYLPEDDRPGVLTFALINKISIKIDMGRPFGILQLNSSLLEGALITLPSLVAAQLSNISLRRGDDILLAEVIPNSQESVVMGPPMLMCRFIADEMEPTVRVKLSNTQLEYKVAVVVALADLLDTVQNEMARANPPSVAAGSKETQNAPNVPEFVRSVRFWLTIRNSTIGLNPNGLPSKGIFLLSDAGLRYSKEPKTDTATIRLDLRKASILIIDDVDKIGHESRNIDHKLYFEENDQVQDLSRAGYVPVGSISNASATIKLSEDKATTSQLLDVEFRNNLFLLETCADSTQTLIQVLSGLAPPSKPTPGVAYRTEIVSIQDMLSSFTGNAFVSEPGPELGLEASQVFSTTSTTDRTDVDFENDHTDDDTDYEDESDDGDQYYPNDLYSEHDEHDHNDRLDDSYIDSELSQSTMTGSIHVAPVNPTADDESTMADSIMAHSMLDFRTDHFVQKSSIGGTAHRWDSVRNTYELGSEVTVKLSPLKVRVRDVHVIWNLFDGYDWQSTRDTISKAVDDLEARAISKQSRKSNQRSTITEDDESVIGDFLFNSIYIGIPANKDPKGLAEAINHEIDDMVSETGSYATGTTVTATPSGRTPGPRYRQQKLRLNRSKQHKMTFELSGVSADVLMFPPESGEVQSSVDVRVKLLEIFDHVPSSTWKKFATYMQEAGEREVDTSMIHLELLNVKPVADLSASEIVLKLTILPLRLHVDQDALDFMTRFFEFKDDSMTSSPSNPSTPPFIQRVEVNPIKLRLDYKPKRVDYAALRSGRTGEFKNFFTLDRSNMVLRRVILYGVSGFDRLGIMLNDIWSPDVQRNQLTGVLAGLAPIRSLVDVGSGVRDLVAVPIREYKKDGRIVRSIQKGALAFAKTTTTELVNFGAKLAIGTQTVLQGAEGMLVPGDRDEDDEATERISLYANQPLGIVQGLRGAYASLERDLLLAKDAIVAVPGEVMASGSATDAAKAVLKQSPTIILRPAIGASKAVGQTLLGAGNTLDKKNRRRIEDKYKRH